MTRHIIGQRLFSKIVSTPFSSQSLAGYLSDDVSAIFIMESYRRERPLYTLSNSIAYKTSEEQGNEKARQENEAA